MCIFRNKWKDFEPTKQYLSVVSGLISITKLHNFIQKYKYIPEKVDHWKTPIEFLHDGGGDCDDFARFTVDVMVRIIGIKDARFIAYYASRKGHAICAFPFRGKYSIFSNNQLMHGFADYLEIGHRFFPFGLKKTVVRDWQGKILDKKRKWFGTL